MEENIRVSIEKVAECADAIQKLSESLKEYTEIYNNLVDTMDYFGEKEERSVSAIKENLPKLTDHIDTIVAAQDGLETHLSDVQNALLKAQPVFSQAGQLLEKAEHQLETTVTILSQHSKAVDDLTETLHQVEEHLTLTPQLAESSARIQRALGTIGDPDALDSVSRKLDRQTEEIQRERQEIVEPLKNAAMFAAVVQKENDVLHKSLSSQLGGIKAELHEQFETMTSEDPESITSKLDYLISVSDDLKSKLDEASVHGKTGGLRGILGFGGRNEESRSADTGIEEMPEGTLEGLIKKSICVVEKTTWYDDYVFAVEEIKGGYASGCIYKLGRPQGEKKYLLKADGFRFYRGPYLKEIAEKEVQKRLTMEW